MKRISEPVGSDGGQLTPKTVGLQVTVAKLPPADKDGAISCRFGLRGFSPAPLADCALLTAYREVICMCAARLISRVGRRRPEEYNHSCRKSRLRGWPPGQSITPVLTLSSPPSCTAFSSQRRHCHRRHAAHGRHLHSSALKNSLSSSAI
jgi:hypothetical protein